MGIVKGVHSLPAQAAESRVHCLHEERGGERADGVWGGGAGELCSFLWEARACTDIHSPKVAIFTLGEKKNLDRSTLMVSTGKAVTVCTRPTCCNILGLSVLKYEQNPCGIPDINLLYYSLELFYFQGYYHID